MTNQSPPRRVWREPYGEAERYECDAVVMATGVGAARGIVAASPALAAAPGLQGVAKIPSTDVAALRLFLDRPVKLRRKSNVFAGFDLSPLAGAKLS